MSVRIASKFSRPSSRILGRIALAGFAAAFIGGCSSDAARLDAFTNPFSSSSRVAEGPTGSLAKGTGATGKVVNAAPTTRVVATPLAPAGNFATRATPSPVAMNTASRSTGATGSLAKGASGVSGSAAGWSAEGGTPIVAAQGESVAMLSNRYGVPESALLKANGFTSASQVQPGTRLVVPVYTAGGGASPARTVATRTIEPKSAVTTAGQKPLPAGKLAKATPEPVASRPIAAIKEPVKATARKELAKAAPAGKDAAKEKPVARIDTPKARPAEAKVVEARVVEAKPLKAPETTVAKTVEPAKTVQVADAKKTDPTTTQSLPPAEAAAPDAASGNPEFRWPARGRVIQGFKAGGNDGINIAVPEGTSVKAAEGGVVAYAGSELKGYGNLVLIRHPNGFVSAYAHNGEVNVKRGENVKRGQTIAKSGQSGNVTSPQLHFELRKGSTPVDPNNYLAGL